LTQIFLDPYYRSLDGFLVLLEKEFSQSGHLFAKRHRIFSANKHDQSPIFIQFLDAMQNILLQYPNCFEFKRELLRDLALVSYLGVFSNFIGNNQKERFQMLLHKKALHSFDFFNNFKEKYLNVNFDGSLKFGKLKVKEVNLHFWKDFFFMYFEPNQDDFEVPLI
jgi:hypothetical protein